MREADEGNLEAARGWASSNVTYMGTAFDAVAADSSQQEMWRLNNNYLEELEVLGDKTVEEKKLIQKDSKSKAYKNRKRK